MIRFDDQLNLEVVLRVVFKPIARLGFRVGLVGRGNLRIVFNDVFRLRFKLRVGLEA